MPVSRRRALSASASSSGSASATTGSAAIAGGAIVNSGAENRGPSNSGHNPNVHRATKSLSSKTPSKVGQKRSSLYSGVSARGSGVKKSSTSTASKAKRTKSFRGMYRCSGISIQLVALASVQKIIVYPASTGSRAVTSFSWNWFQ